MGNVLPCRPLAPGSTIGVFASGSPTAPERVSSGEAEVVRRGYSVSIPAHPSASYGSEEHLFFSGSVATRADAIHTLLNDSDVGLLLACRGGYGTMAVLSALDFSKIRAARKIVSGYSDVTPLLNNIVVRAGIPAIHGATLATEFASSSASPEARESVDLLIQMVSDTSNRFVYSGSVVRGGAGEGHLLGGNLTMLQTMLGTPWDVDYSGAILCLEEVQEAPYRVHRALYQLKQAGKFDRLSGVVFGRMSRCSAASGATVETVLRRSIEDIFAGTSYPILMGFEFGHEGKNVPLPLGCAARIVDDTLEIRESPVGE